jgi:hypothetical protein
MRAGAQTFIAYILSSARVRAPSWLASISPRAYRSSAPVFSRIPIVAPKSCKSGPITHWLELSLSGTCITSAVFSQRSARLDFSITFWLLTSRRSNNWRTKRKSLENHHVAAAQEMRSLSRRLRRNMQGRTKPSGGRGLKLAQLPQSIHFLIALSSPTRNRSSAHIHTTPSSLLVT